MYSRPQFIDLTYMGGTGPCAPMTIIFGGIIQSQYTSLNIKCGVNRTFQALKTLLTYMGGTCRSMYSRPQFVDLTYMGGTRRCGPTTIIFGGIIQSQHTSLNIKSGVYRTFHELKTQFTDLTYMGGPGPAHRQHTSLNTKFGVNRTFHVLKTPVYRFVLYGRYQTLKTDDDNFWQCCSELAYKPKYQIWCLSDVP